MTDSVKTIMDKINAEVSKIEKRTLRGLIRATILIRRDMETTPPLIPVDLGNLRASWFVVTSNGSVVQGKSPSFKGEKADRLSQSLMDTISEAQSQKVSSTGPYVVFGFSAYYAAAVHEMVGAEFKRPGAGALFLSNALARNANQIVQVIAKEARKR